MSDALRQRCLIHLPGKCSGERCRKNAQGQIRPTTGRSSTCPDTIEPGPYAVDHVQNAGRRVRGPLEGLLPQGRRLPAVRPGLCEVYLRFPASIGQRIRHSSFIDPALARPGAESR